MLSDCMSMKIFGVGNTLLCDDGIGVEVSKQIITSPNAFVYQGEIFAERCLSHIQPNDIVIIIDAVMLNRTPGDVIVLPLNECKKYYPPKAFCHDVSLLYSLLYGHIHVSGYLIGIQAAEIDYKEGLSDVLADKLPNIVSEVNIILKGMTNMHHITMAQSALDIALRTAKENNISKLEKIYMTKKADAHHSEDEFIEAFKAIAKSTAAENTEIIVEAVPDV